MPGRRRAEPAQVGVAFAPGHVTGIFAPSATNRDPRARGSLGAGIVLNIGVNATARWTPGKSRRLVIRADVRRPLPISREAAERLWSRRGGRLEIQIQHSLPIGQGFGMSAAGALATGLATAFALRTDPSGAIEVAHLADLLGGGGLGGVAAILGGGLEIRTRPGIPPWGRVLHRTFPLPCFVGVLGAPLSTPRFLRSPEFLERVRITATPGLERMFRRPTPARFLAESQAFADALGLASPSLTRFMQAVRREGVAIGQAMFGRSFFAVPHTSSGRRRLIRELTRRRLRAVELRAAQVGAVGDRIRAQHKQSLLPTSRLGGRS